MVPNYLRHLPDIETGVELFKLQTRGGEKIIINGSNFPSQIGEAKVVVTYGSSNGDRFFAKDCVIYLLELVWHA